MARSQRDPISQYAVTGLLDPVQDPAIHTAHDFRHRQGPAFGAWQRIERPRRLGVKFLCSADFKPHELGKFRFVPPVQEILLPVGETREVFLRHIDATAFCIVAQVAKNIGQLKGHAEIDGIVLGARGGGAEHVQADQSHHRRHPITVERQLVEGGVPGGREVHLDALDEFLEIGLRNGQLPYVPGKADGDGERRRAVVGGGQLAPPAGQFFLRMTAGRRLVHGVVHFLTEGVDRVHRFAAGFRKKQKGVVEIAPAFFGEGRAVGLGFSWCHHRVISVSASSVPQVVRRTREGGGRKRLGAKWRRVVPRRRSVVGRGG